MKIFHFIKTYFKQTEHVNQDWLDARYRFFLQFTYQSILRQTVPCRLWVCCDPYMGPKITWLAKQLPQNTLFTFGEHPFHCMNLGEQDRQALINCDYVYITRLDSDDLYEPTALAEVQRITPHGKDAVEASIFSTGYMYDTVNKQLGTYCNPSSPFHTLMFPRQTFLDVPKYNKLFIGDHSKVRDSYYCHCLPNWKFCVLIHGNNFRSTFNYSRLPLKPKVSLEEGWSIERFIDGSC